MVRHHRFHLHLDRRPDGWHARLEGTVVVWSDGPHAAPDHARAAACHEVQRWRRRARALGGWIWWATGRTVLVALPPPHEARGALPFAPDPVSRVGPAAPWTRSG